MRSKSLLERRIGSPALINRLKLNITPPNVKHFRKTKKTYKLQQNPRSSNKDQIMDTTTIKSNNVVVDSELETHALNSTTHFSNSSHVSTVSESLHDIYDTTSRVTLANSLQISSPSQQQLISLNTLHRSFSKQQQQHSYNEIHKKKQQRHNVL